MFKDYVYAMNRPAEDDPSERGTRQMSEHEENMTTVHQRFTKRPGTIEAARLTGDTAQWHDIYLWVEANTLGSFEPLDVIEGRKPYPPSGVSIDPRDGRLIISTLEGLHWADEGDWIIRGVAGEFYPVKNEIFEATYQPADDHVEGEQPDPTYAEVQAAARAVFETRDDPYDDTEWDELTGADRERWKCYALAALVAAREVSGR